MSLFARLARSVTRHPVATVVAWVIAAFAMFVFSEVGWGDYGNLQARTTTGEPGVRGTDSAVARLAIEDSVPFEAGTTFSAMLLGVNAQDPALADRPEGSARDHRHDERGGARGLAARADSRRGLRKDPDPELHDATGRVPRPERNGHGHPRTLAPQADDAILLDVNHTVRSEFADLEASARAVAPDAAVTTYSNRLLFEHFDKRISEDLVVGEVIALPLALIVMVFVFGGFLAASMPIAGAIASIAGGFTILYGFTFPYTVDNSAQSVVTVLGIGLCIDYGLLIVSRYREELAAIGGDPHLARGPAIERAMATAGRTVFFSAVTVAIAVGGLLTFSPDLMKAFGGAALGVVIMALLVAHDARPRARLPVRRQARETGPHLAYQRRTSHPAASRPTSPTTRVSSRA